MCKSVTRNPCQRSEEQIDNIIWVMMRKPTYPTSCHPLGQCNLCKYLQQCVDVRRFFCLISQTERDTVRLKPVFLKILCKKFHNKNTFYLHHFCWLSLVSFSFNLNNKSRPGILIFECIHLNMLSHIW